MTHALAPAERRLSSPFTPHPQVWSALSWCMAVALAPAAWAGDAPPAPRVSLSEARSVLSEDLKATVSVEKIKVDMLQGDELGHSSFGWFCINAQPMTVTENFIKNYGTAITSVATQELKRLGYPLASSGKSNAFDTDISAAPDFRLGGLLKEAKFEICSMGSSTEGWIHLKIDWALYSERQQKVVVQATGEGLGQSKDKIEDLGKRAMLSSLHNFLASPEVLRALKGGTPAAPAAAASGASTAVVSGVSSGVAAVTAATTSGTAATSLAATPAPTAVASTAASLILKGGPALPGGALKNQAALRAAVVTLETAAGSGSGFYIDREGYLLTNVHVVKGAKFVKVKLQNGDKLVAEVLKLNERADVALLKTASVDMDVLSVRPGTLEVGEDVFAIGSPLGVLTHSMTRGVLSADRTLQGRRVLQSDAAVTFGSSGGPLLDAEGRVVAITQGGVESGKGFNFFIPIQDALRSLEMSIK